MNRPFQSETTGLPCRPTSRMATTPIPNATGASQVNPSAATAMATTTPIATAEDGAALEYSQSMDGVAIDRQSKCE